MCHIKSSARNRKERVRTVLFRQEVHTAKLRNVTLGIIMVEMLTRQVHLNCKQ
jgi:hypothetical protein